MTEALDALILHSLQLSPRVSFRRVAAVIGVSEQTVARHYYRLCREGVVRVVGLVNPRVHGNTRWVARIRAKPDRIPALAQALVQRSEVSYVNITSGGTELFCIIHAPVVEVREGVLLQQLPRSTSVIDIHVDLVLHEFGEPVTSPWTPYGHRLSSEQAGQILGDRAGRASTGQLISPTAQDGPLLEALTDDGRAPQALLAQQTGWSAARVARRIAALETSGSLLYEIDLLPERLGYHLNAMLWLTVAPQHLHSAGEQIAAHDEIAFAGALSGRNNLIAAAICRDVGDLYRYLTERLAAIAHVQTYDVSIRNQRLKQSASLVAYGRLLNAGQISRTARTQRP